jgi:protein-disulfide isomerase
MKQSSKKSVIAIVLLSALMGCHANENAGDGTQAPGLDTSVTTEGEASGALVSEPPPPARKIVEAGPGELDPRVLYQVPLQGNEPQMGPDDALITIIEFGDFDCPFCKDKAPTLVQLREKYGADLRVIWMNYPLPGHRNARPAATASLEAQSQKGDKGFWQMHDKLFANQGSLTRETLERLAKELGLNIRKFRHALDTDKYAEAIDRDVALGTKLHVPGTPSYFMNGRFMAGFPLQTWSFAIDRHIGPLRRVTESGQIPRSELYDRIIADGKPAP